MAPSLFIRKIVTKLISDGVLGDTENRFQTFKIEMIHKRRLSDVYMVKIYFPNRTFQSVCIKIVKCDKFDAKSIEINRRKLEHEFAMHLLSYERSRKLSGFSVVRPMAVYSDDLAFITESFDNSKTIESLLTKGLILGGHNKLEHIMYSSGVLLSQYHGLKIENMSGANKEIEELKQYILVRLALIYEYFEKEQKNISLTKSLQGFNKEFSELIIQNNFGKNLLTCSHGDFTPANILYDGETLALIDFSEAVEKSPRYVDIGSFVNYLNMLPLNKPIYSIQKIETLKSSFIKGYCSENEINLLLLRLYQFRFLSTNMLTQIYEMQSSKVKNILMQRRIKRYMSVLESFSFY